MDVFDLQAMLSLNTDSYESGLKSAKSSAQSFGSAFGTVASGIGTATKVVAGAVTTVATGISALTVSAVKSYAEYEQLEGGISKLFGTAGQSFEDYAESFEGTLEEAKASYEQLEATESQVMENASNAWKTAGISANEYMTTVTSLSGALASSLDYDMNLASEYADRAITDMSDIANTYGYTMDEVSDIYTSVSRGLYQTLDTLTAGAFAGTKEGYTDLINTMADLVDIQEELGITVEKDNLDYDNFVNAMSVYNEYMGIAGTTAREASTTISGSLNQMQSAWSNLVTGIADEDADLESLMNNLVESLVGITDETTGEKIQNGFIDNIVPVIETSLTSIGTLIEELVPEALSLIPTLIENVLPSLTSASTSLVSGMVTSLTDNMDTISDVVNQLLDAFLELIPQMLSLGGSIMSTLASAILDNIDSILDASLSIIEMLITGLSNNANSLVSGAITIITKLIGFITQNIGLIINGAITIVTSLATALISNVGQLIPAGIELLNAVLDGLIEFLPTLIDYLPQIIDSIVNVLSENIPTILDASTTMFLAIVEALPDILIALTDALPEIIDSIVEFLTGDAMGDILEASILLFSEIVLALPEIAGSLLGALVDLLDSVIEGINGFLDSMWESAGNLWNAFIDVLADTDLVQAIGDWIMDCVDSIAGFVDDFYTAGKNLVDGFVEGFKSVSLSAIGANATSTALSAINSTAEVNSPSKATMRTGRSMAEGLGIGWEEGMEEVDKGIEDDLNYSGNIDLTTNYDSNGMITASSTSALTESDIDRIISGLRITINNYTQLDGDILDEHSYDYAVNRIGNETTALAVAQGGY